MPCFCETPAIKKEQWYMFMYTKAIALLSKKEQDELLQDDFFHKEIHEFSIAIILCKACKFLTVDQMQSIGGVDNYIGLYRWYAEHLLYDYSLNKDPEEKQIALMEAKRIGYNFIHRDFGVSMEPII